MLVNFPLKDTFPFAKGPSIFKNSTSIISNFYSSSGHEYERMYCLMNIHGEVILIELRGDEVFKNMENITFAMEKLMEKWIHGFPTHHIRSPSCLLVRPAMGSVAYSGLVSEGSNKAYIEELRKY